MMLARSADRRGSVGVRQARQVSLAQAAAVAIRRMTGAVAVWKGRSEFHSRWAGMSLFAVRYPVGYVIHWWKSVSVHL